MNRLIFQRYIFITLFVIVLAVSFIIGYLRQPKADVATTENLSPSVIWGRVTDSDGKPIPDIIVTIGSKGAVTGSAGGYVLSSDEIGRHSVQFKHRNTNEIYFESSHGEAIFTASGQSMQYDFQIKRLIIQPTPIAVVGTPFATSPPDATSTPQATPTPTATPAPKPAQPTNLSASFKQNPRRVELTWKESATNESGFTIVRTEDKTYKVKLINVPANSTTFTDTTAEKGRTYFYKVRAFSGSGVTISYSAYTNERKISVK